MSPRDQFATAALTGILATTTGTEPPDAETAVEMAYKIADEMMRHSMDEIEVLKLACAASDVWVEYWKRVADSDQAAREFMPKYAETLSKLEAFTRPCSMRKVRV